MKASEAKKRLGFLKGLAIGLIAGLVLGLIAPLAVRNLKRSEPADTPKDPVFVDARYLGFTAIDFMDAILGSSRLKDDLVVMEQDIEYVSLITKAGFGDWAIFRKTKTVTFAGTGVYTIDLSKLDASRIFVDDEERTVTLVIPHTVLSYVVLNPENMTFDDTEKGLLAFGDLRLTAEEQNAFEVLAKQNMAKRLDTDQLRQRADSIAQIRCWELFQPLVDTVSPAYRLATRFE